MTKNIVSNIATYGFRKRLNSFFIKGLLVSILLIVYVTNSSSQVLINEYFNTNNNQQEWIELIVTEENANLTNLILLDSYILDSSPLEFSGGVQFKDVDFWRNIPKGTFIVIYLKDVDNNLLTNDKVKGRLVVEATEDTLFDLVCDNCDLGNWESEAFIIDNNAELFSIANNSTNVHSLGHTSDGVGHFVNNMGILTKLTLSNNEAVSVIPGDAVFSYFGGYDEFNDFAVKNNLVSRGGANRRTSGVPINYLFIDELRKPEWINPGALNITKVGSGYNVKWNKILNLPQADNYYTFILLLTNGTPQNADLPQNGRNYNVDDVIGNSKVISVIQGNQNGNVDISSGLNCGTDYTVSLILGRFRDLDNNFNQFLSNGISYNKVSYPKGSIKRESVPNFQIYTEGNKTSFCVQRDTSITLSTNLLDVNLYRFTWYKNGIPIISGADFGENSEFQVTESGMYFTQIINGDGCFRNSNAIQIEINNRPTVGIKTNDRYILDDTLIVRCFGDTVELKAETDYGEVSWYKKNNNIYNLVENGFRLAAVESGDYVSIANDGDCADTSRVVSIEILNYLFSTDYLETAFFKYLNSARIIDLEIENNSDRVLIFEEDDFDIEAPFKLLNINFPITLEENEKIKIQIILDSDDFENRDYILNIKNGCNIERNIKIKPIRVSSEVVINPSQIIFPPKIRCSSVSVDSIVSILNNSDFDLEIEASSKIPFEIITNVPFELFKQERKVFIISFNSNFNGIYYDTLKIVYKSSDNSLVDSVFIPLQGEVYEPILEVKPDSIFVGDLSDCEFYKDTVIKLINYFPSNITIDEQFDNPNVRFETLPIVIPKNDSIEVAVRIAVNNNGNFAYNTSFKSIPCTILNNLHIFGSKTEIAYNLDDKDLDFDTLFSCSSPKFRERNTRLRITSDVELYSRVDSLYVPNGFETDLEIGQELFNINDISVTFTPNIYQTYSDYLIIKYFPCGDIDSILLKGEYKDVNVSIPDTIYFNTVTVGNADFQNLKLVSKSLFAFELLIGELSSDKFSFSDYRDEVSFINFDDEIDFDLEYYSDDDGIFVDSIKVTMNYPCLIEKYVYLVGSSLPINDVDLFLELPGSREFDANEEFEIIFSISSKLNDLDDFEITNAQIDIEINAFVLHFISASNLNPRPLNFDYDIPNNKLRVNFDKLYETDLVFRFKPLLGNDTKTLIKISDFKYESSNNLVVTTDSSLVTLIGICDFEERFVSIGNQSNLRVFQDNLQAAEIRFNVTNGEKVNVEIFDSRGSLVKQLLNKYVDVGEYQFKVDELPNGTYFINFKNGLDFETKSFVIVK